MTYESKTSPIQEIRLPMHDAFSVKENGGEIENTSFEGGAGVFVGSSYIRYPRIGYTNQVDKLKMKIQFIVEPGDGGVLVADGATNFLNNSQLKVEVLGGVVVANVGAIITTGTTAIDDGLKHDVHISIGLINYEIYVDGELEMSGLVGAYNNPFTDGMYVGSVRFLFGGFTAPLTGQVDFVSYTVGEEYTAEEVKNDYENKTYRDIHTGRILDIDSRLGVLQDNLNNNLVDSNVSVDQGNRYKFMGFNGVNSKVDTTSRILPVGDFTCSIRAKPQSNGGAIMGQYVNGGVGRFAVYYSPTAMTWRMVYAGQVVNFTKDLNMRDMITVTRVGNTVTLYKNAMPLGVIVSATNVLDTIFNIGGNVTLGYLKGGLSRALAYGEGLDSYGVTQLYTSQKIDYV